MHQQGNCKIALVDDQHRHLVYKSSYTHNLLFAVFGASDEVNCLHVPYVDFIAQDVCEDDFGDISQLERSGEPVILSSKGGSLFLLISIQIPV